MAPVVIRLLTPADSISEITQLLHLAYRPLLEQGMRYHASHQEDDVTLRRCLKGDTFLALMNGTIVGTITLNSIANTKGSPWYDRPEVVSFGQFAVQPDLQKHGIGAQLMNLIEKRAVELSAKELALDTSEHATALIAMYERRGYRFIEYAQWDVTNYRSVILSKEL